jgi:hypothetical protein
LTQGYPWQVNVRSADAVSEAHLKLAPIPPSRWKSWIPKSVDECLLRALSKAPHARQRSVSEFHEQLAELEIVDDGSAKYRTDAPTVPTVETMARGGPATDSGLEAEKPTPAAGRGWLEDARSRLAEEVLSIDIVSETATHREGGPLAAPRLEPPRASVSAARGAAEAPEADSAPRADTPMTGSGAPRVDGRARVSPALLGLAASVVVAGTWGGWRALHSTRYATASLPVAPPAQLALAPPAPAESITAPASLTDPPAESVLVDAAVGSGNGASGTLPREIGTASRRPAAVARPSARRPTQQIPNLDDVIFGMDDVPKHGSAPGASDERGAGAMATHGAAAASGAVLTPGPNKDAPRGP